MAWSLTHVASRLRRSHSRSQPGPIRATKAIDFFPEMNLACSGFAPNASKEQWSALSDQASAASGLAPGRDLFGVDDTLLSAPLRNSMETLYELFSQAPVLGSLIDPHGRSRQICSNGISSRFGTCLRTVLEAGARER